MTDARENGATLLVHYAYDTLGRRTSLTHGNSATVDYGYAPNNDLVSVDQRFNPLNSATFIYAYNKVHQPHRPGCE